MGTSAAEKNRGVVADEEGRLVSGPMSEAEVRLLRDVQAYIDFAIRNGLGFARVLSVLSHDIGGIGVYHGMSCEDAVARGFVPKVSGYSEITADSVGEPAEPAE